MPDAEKIRAEVEKYLKFKGKRNKIQLSFYGGTFLGLDKNYRANLLDTAGKLVLEKKIDTIRFSTRPDTITKQNLDSLKGCFVETIELGVQSMNDHVLSLAQRGHSSKDTINAASLLKEYGFETGMQMMVGLPGDTNDTALDTARKIAGLSPDFVRIYPLIVLKGSLVHKWYEKKIYKPLSLAGCVTLVKEIYKIFSKTGIPVIRMGLQASDLLQDKDSMIAGPWHPAFGHLVFSEIFFDKAASLLDKASVSHESRIVLHVNPRFESRLRGNKNQNIEKLKALYPMTELQIKSDPLVMPEQLELSTQKILFK